MNREFVIGLGVAVREGEVDEGAEAGMPKERFNLKKDGFQGSIMWK